MQDWNFRKPIIVEQSGIAQITVAFEQGMNADFSDVRFVAAGVYTHEAGTAYFDNYKVTGIGETVPVRVGTEVNPN